MPKQDSRLKSVPVHQSMIERPLPFFGAGGEAASIMILLVFLASNFAGLLSYATLGSILLGVLATYLIKLFREVDPYGPESFVIGSTTPREFRKGYSLDQAPASPYGVRPRDESS